MYQYVFMAAKLLNSPDITSKKVFFFHCFSFFLVLCQFLCVAYALSGRTPTPDTQFI